LQPPLPPPTQQQRPQVPTETAEQQRERHRLAREVLRRRQNERSLHENRVFRLEQNERILRENRELLRQQDEETAAAAERVCFPFYSILVEHLPFLTSFTFEFC
jgi:hypothetical protein